MLAFWWAFLSCRCWTSRRRCPLPRCRGCRRRRERTSSWPRQPLPSTRRRWNLLVRWCLLVWPAAANSEGYGLPEMGQIIMGDGQSPALQFRLVFFASQVPLCRRLSRPRPGKAPQPEIGKACRIFWRQKEQPKLRCRALVMDGPTTGHSNVILTSLCVSAR